MTYGILKKSLHASDPNDHLLRSELLTQWHRSPDDFRMKARTATAMWARPRTDSPTNALFAVLMLGLQRLEETGVLPQAHHSMLEDMLEGWTGRDDMPSKQELSKKWRVPLGHSEI